MISHEDTGLGFIIQTRVEKTLRRHPDWRKRVSDTLDRLATDPSNPRLKTHKLKGDLAGFWACTVEHDCRIVFEFVRDSQTRVEEILLIDIGKHDEVY